MLQWCTNETFHDNSEFRPKVLEMLNFKIDCFHHHCPTSSPSTNATNPNVSPSFWTHPCSSHQLKGSVHFQVPMHLASVGSDHSRSCERTPWLSAGLLLSWQSVYHCWSYPQLSTDQYIVAVVIIIIIITMFMIVIIVILLIFCCSYFPYHFDIM